MKLEPPRYHRSPLYDEWGCHAWGASRAVVLIPALVVFLLIMGMTVTQTSRSTVDAQEDARKWAEQLPDAIQVTCEGRDVDRNGYIDCTVFRDDLGPIFIECATGFSGCRVQRESTIQIPYH